MTSFDHKGEASRFYDLSDEDILDLLSRRNGNKTAAKALDTVKRMFELSARQRPTLAPGLLAAAGLIDLYRECLDPTGKLIKPDTIGVARVLLDAEDRLPRTKPKPDPLPSELVITKPPAIPSQLTPVRKLGGVLTPDRKLADETIAGLVPGMFTFKELLDKIGCRKETLNNALIKARNDRLVAWVSMGVYRRLGNMVTINSASDHVSG